MPRIPSSSSLLAAALIAAGVFAPSARAAQTPEPEDLLDAALSAPTIPYQGRVMVTQWYGKQTRAEEMRVLVLPPNKIRREFLSPDGNVTRVSISDGAQESVLRVRSGKTVIGNAVGSDSKILPPDQERSVLLENYELAASTGEKVAGRTTWRLTLKPKIEGKSWQTLWLDQDTQIVLRTKRSLPKRSSASQAQFLSFEPRKRPDESLFEVNAATSAVRSRGLAPKFMTLDQLNKATGDRSRLPERLPGGFVFESADVFPIGKSSVRHARYTDGLTVISLFQTEKPVRLPKGGIIPPGPHPVEGRRAALHADGRRVAGTSRGHRQKPALTPSARQPRFGPAVGSIVDGTARH